MYADVAIPRSTAGCLTYSVPEQLRPLVQAGARVRVPLQSRIVAGVLVALRQTTDLAPEQLRPLAELLDLRPLLPQHLLQLAQWVASYYRCPIGDTLAAMLPASLLRSDVEQVELTPKGAVAEIEALPPLQAALIEVLRDKGRLGTPSLLAAAGARSRSPLDALELAGMVRSRRRRRARPPRVELAAVTLAKRPLSELLAACHRAPRRRQVLEWLADHDRAALVREVRQATGCSDGVIRAMLQDGLLLSFSQLEERRPRWSLLREEQPIRLNAAQQRAVDAVIEAVSVQRYAPFLLDGVTGSGKTEVYVRCLESTLQQGRRGLVLVPEIGLTPSAVGVLQRRFGSEVGVLHSAQTDAERWREWRAIRDGDVRVVVGPRSALFAPLEQLGLIVVDEEHDGAYKQQEVPRYQARDLALVLGKQLDLPVLLCSATPSLEASALIRRGMAQVLRLPERVAGGTLPEVELVDLRLEEPDPGEQGRTLFSRRLRETLAKTIEEGDQAILLMQRRGWAPVLQCRDCGHRMSCPSCSVALVVHQRSDDLRCHYCNHSQPLPESCPSCSGTLLNALGAGTEKVADHLYRLFPEVKAGILDRDTVRRRDGLQRTLGAFDAGNIQVLVGTQMIAKGHHFPRVTLTGVISADAQLGLPDFRAGERTFQLLTQVAGRAGRGSRPGRVIIQTYYPDHPAVRFACSHDTAAFCDEELTYRRAFFYPPAARLALVRFEALRQERAREAAHQAAAATAPLPEGTRLRGPSPAPLERIRQRWRWQLLITSTNRDSLRAVLARIEQVKIPSEVRCVVDVDPFSTL